MKRNILGPRIRERRRELAITQADLARTVEISPSYLNLIEHNKRDIGGVLLSKVAAALEIPLHDLDGAADRRLLETLLEMAQRPELQSLGADSSSAGELIGRFPGWARSMVALTRSEREATRVAQILGDRLAHDPVLGETLHKMLSKIAALRSAAEIVNEDITLELEQQNRFYAIIQEESHQLSQHADALAAYFDNVALEKRALTPVDEVDALFESYNNHFAEIETLATELHSNLPQGSADLRFDSATNLAEQQMTKCIDRLIAKASTLDTEIARTRAKQVLLQYSVAAIIAPNQPFQAVASDCGFDISLLADCFTTSYEVVFSRLSALLGANGQARFGYFQSNASGTILQSRHLPGLRVSRFGSACPLWVLYRAQQTPATLMRQLVVLPTGERYVFVAYSHSSSAVGYGQPQHYITEMIAFNHRDAENSVYAVPSDSVAEPIGISCRSCPRKACEHRVPDPLTG